MLAGYNLDGKQQETAMRTESATPPDQRFLMIGNVLSDSFVRELNGRLIPESMTRSKTLGTEYKTLTARYLETDKNSNRIWCFTHFAYAEIPIGKKFDILFDCETRSHIETPSILQFAILSLGGLSPVDELSHGHRHICVFDFPDGIPHLLASVPKVAPTEQFSGEWRVGVTDADSWKSISKTYGAQSRKSMS